MVALEAKGTARHVCAAPCAARWARALDVLVNEDPVLEYAREASPSNLLSGGIELGRVEGHFQ
jgi:hypothetical protein